MQHAWGRVLVRAARRGATLQSARVASQLRAAAPSHAFARCAVRFESSESTPSRFLSLADEEKAKAGEEGQEASEDTPKDSEGQDGDVEVEAIAEVNKGGVPENDELDELVMELFMENPLRWTSETLARKFHLSKPRVEAIIWMKRMELELSPEEFRAKVAAAKEKALKEATEQAKKLADAESAGDDKELARLKKRARQEQEATQPDDVLDAHEEAVLMGIDEEAFRNPDFFFLSDEFEGYPPLMRRMGKHGHTDQVYPEEALELQRLASNNKIELHKSFANPKNSESKAKFRLAVKDITAKKKYLLVRDESRTLRLATKDEVLPRTWVRRPAHFRGLDKELSEQ
ncbi:hypothetical protein PRNP1_007321 [Phytophthora ramorum]